MRGLHVLLCRHTLTCDWFVTLCIRNTQKHTPPSLTYLSTSSLTSKINTQLNSRSILFSMSWTTSCIFFLTSEFSERRDGCKSRQDAEVEGRGEGNGWVLNLSLDRLNRYRNSIAALQREQHTLCAYRSAIILFSLLSVCRFKERPRLLQQI